MLVFQALKPVKSYSIKMVETIDTLNSWMFFNSLRRYQYLLATKQYFHLYYNGILFTIKSCAFIKGYNNLCFVSEDNAAVMILPSKGISSGYELQVDLTPPNEYPYNEFSSLDNIILIQGRRHFAHFMWNELDGLIRLSQISSSMLMVKQNSDTIFDLSILPNIRIVTTSLKDESTLAVGSRIVSEAVRSNILANLRPITTKGKAIIDLIGHNPIILFGIRGRRSRELCNQVEFYAGLIEKLLSKCKDICFLLDGISFDRSFHYKNRAAIASESTIQERISKIILLSPGANVHSLHGISYDDYLHIARNVNYCVTHSGTMHHKICWLYTSIPSTLITNHPKPHLVAAWHSNQSSESLKIDCLPALLKFHENTSCIGVRRTREERYSITNISECIESCFSVIAKDVLAGKNLSGLKKGKSLI